MAANFAKLPGVLGGATEREGLIGEITSDHR